MRQVGTVVKWSLSAMFAATMIVAPVGCGGGSVEEGQKFEAPPDAKEPGIDKPDAYKNMSPREKKAMKKDE